MLAWIESVNQAVNNFIWGVPAMILLMGVGLASGAVLVLAMGLDPLSAYLATSPGGADSMAVIAATSTVETSFVMAMQLARFLLVLITGPAISRWLARHGARHIA